jgi:arylsulfatase
MDNTITLAETMKSAGYRTIMSGKWHVGGDYNVADKEQWRRDAGDDCHPTPNQRGFDEFYGMLGGGGSYFNPPTLMHNGDIVEPEGEDYYFTDAITTHAIGEIEKSTAEGLTFFLYLPYTAPHWPLHAFPEDIEKYRGRYMDGWDTLREKRYQCLKDAGIINKHWPMSPRDPKAPAWDDASFKEWEDLRMAVYAAQVDRMDWNLGRVITVLEENGIFDNTLIIFISDNGGCAEFLRENGEKGTWPEFYNLPTRDGRMTIVGNNPERKPGSADTFMSYDLPWANLSNTPFRLFKSWVHEGGISTPMVVSWPDKIRETRIVHDVCHVVDIMPTLCDIAGIEYPDSYMGRDIQPAEGTSFVPLLTDEPAEMPADRALFWEHYGCKAVRRRNMKLVNDGRKGKYAWELYDIEQDRTELNDLAAVQPEVVEEMAGQWRQWADRCGV